jgi:hypothetical protein
MAVNTIMELTEKKYSLGFIAALLTAIVFLAGYVKVKDNQVFDWVEKHNQCELDKIERLDKSLLEMTSLLNKTQDLIRKNDSINSRKK